MLHAALQFSKSTEKETTKSAFSFLMTATTQRDSATATTVRAVVSGDEGHKAPWTAALADAAVQYVHVSTM